MKRITHHIVVISLLSILLLTSACSNQKSSTPDTSHSSMTSASPAPLQTSANDEMFELKETQQQLKQPIIAGETVPVSKNRNDLLQFAKKSFEKGDFSETIAFADVLLLMNPTDLDAMELRGRAFKAQGDNVSSNQDLNRCCGGGRPSCCQNQ